MNTQCPFCMETVEGDEVERLAHCLGLHSTRLAMAQAVLASMRSEGVGFETSRDRVGYRDWLEARSTSA